MVPHHPTSQTSDHSEAGLAAVARYLDGLREYFPAFRIWREITGDHIVYVARRRQPGTRPHTVVTRRPHPRG